MTVSNDAVLGLDEGKLFLTKLDVQPEDLILGGVTTSNDAELGSEGKLFLTMLDVQPEDLISEGVKISNDAELGSDEGKLFLTMLDVQPEDLISGGVNTSNVGEIRSGKLIFGNLFVVCSCAYSILCWMVGGTGILL